MIAAVSYAEPEGVRAGRAASCLRLGPVAAVAASLSSTAWSQDAAWPQDLDYSKLAAAEIMALDCEGDVSAGIDRFAGECYAEQSQVSRRQIDEVYAKTLANAAPRFRPRLKQAQQDWQRYATSACAIWANEEGTWPAMLAMRCEAKVARARAEELQNLEAID